MSYENCACVDGCGNCEQLDYAAIVGDAKRFERERIIQILHSDEGRDILVKGDNAFGSAIMLEVLIKGESK